MVMDSATLCPECFHIRPTLGVPPLRLLRGLGPALVGRCHELVEAEESVGGVAGPCWCANEFHKDTTRPMSHEHEGHPRPPSVEVEAGAGASVSGPTLGDGAGLLKNRFSQ